MKSLGFNKCPECKTPLTIELWEDLETDEVFEIGYCPDCEMHVDNEKGMF